MIHQIDNKRSIWGVIFICAIIALSGLCIKNIGVSTINPSEAIIQDAREVIRAISEEEKREIIREHYIKIMEEIAS